MDLPQPEGPTNTTNSPSAMSKVTPWMTATLPKLLVICRRLRVAMPSYFTPAEAMPWVIYFCKTRNTMLTGSRVSTVIASR